MTFAQSETPTRERAAARLRTVLQINAVTSVASGAVMLLAAAPLGRWLDVSGWVVAALGLGLIVFAVDVLLLTRAPAATMVEKSLLVSLGDLGWVAGSAAVIAAGLVSTAGAVAMGVVALVVLDYAVTQLVLRRRAGEVS